MLSRLGGAPTASDAAPGIRNSRRPGTHAPSGPNDRLAGSFACQSLSTQSQQVVRQPGTGRANRRTNQNQFSRPVAVQLATARESDRRCLLPATPLPLPLTTRMDTSKSVHFDSRLAVSQSVSRSAVQWQERRKNSSAPRTQKPADVHASSTQNLRGWLYRFTLQWRGVSKFWHRP